MVGYYVIGNVDLVDWVRFCRNFLLLCGLNIPRTFPCDYSKGFEKRGDVLEQPMLSYRERSLREHLAATVRDLCMLRMYGYKHALSRYPGDNLESQEGIWLGMNVDISPPSY